MHHLFTSITKETTKHAYTYYYLQAEQLNVTYGATLAETCIRMYRITGKFGEYCIWRVSHLNVIDLGK